MRPAALLPLAVVLWPATAPAQDGPSFDCRDSDTRTELAICASPELARLELRMFEAYQGLVASIGEGEARRIADELLVRRQACEGDPACIAERLLISMEVFEQRARPRDAVAELEIEPTVPLPDREVEAAPAPEEEVAALEAPAADPDLPLAAQAPWPPESAPIPPSREDSAVADAALEDEPAADVEVASAEEDIAADQEIASAEDIAPVEDVAPVEDTEIAQAPEISEAIEGAEPASSDGAGSQEASFDTPISWAFMDLSREERAALQARLQEAGLYDGSADGSWTNATRAALETAAAQAGTEGFDLSTQNGAALLLDFVSSDAFGGAAGTVEETLDDSQF